MLQPAFLLELLGQCRAQGIDAAIETAGNVPWEQFEAVMSLAGLFLYDVKHVDDSAHALGTGAGCARILKNLERLLGGGARVWVRIPVIPGFNADEPSMRAIAARLAGLQGFEKIELMPYHRLGLGKYESLGRVCSTAELVPPVPEELAAISGLFAARGLTVHWAQNP
jgi:pyruvate formate lyase activating enzyme